MAQKFEPGLDWVLAQADLSMSADEIRRYKTAAKLSSLYSNLRTAGK
jgi:hypothetical protein